MLSAVNLAALAYELAQIGADSKLPANAAALVIVLCLLGGVILLVTEHSLGESLIGTLGFVAALYAAGLHYGTSGILVIVVLSLLTLWFLGLVRGLLP
jgi:hypothetical protein